MAIISAQEWELLAFFAVNPKPRDPDVPCAYNDFLYEIERNGVSLSCTINPAYKDVRLQMTLQGDTLYELDAVDVVDVRCVTEPPGNEVLEIMLSPQESLRLVVDPAITLRHVYAGAI